MQISNKFSIAIHMLLCMDTFNGTRKITSDFMADSINTNPVIIRNILSNLKEAGIIDVKRGTGGATIISPLKDISLLSIYRAVGCMKENSLFKFHDKPNTDCPVGRNIRGALEDKMHRAQHAMEMELDSMTMADVKADFAKLLAEEEK